MVSAINAIEDLGHQTESLYADKAPGSMGKDDFLKLLVTQLEYQDPLDPQDPAEYTSQLTQFSNLEQLMAMNESMSGVTDAIVSLQMLQAASNNTQATSLIGKDVLYEGGTLRVDSGGGNLQVYADEAMSNSVVTLRNALGQVVRAFNVGSIGRGTNPISLPSDLPAGIYSVTIEGQGPTGEEVTAWPLVVGRATGVSFGDDGVTYLHVGSDKIKLNEVHSVHEAL
ncbi:MAG: flagellar hook assembly protein FlgD [Candidatus Sumerlaeota bacterium]